jgi:hypothetical protein
VVESWQIGAVLMAGFAVGLWVWGRWRLRRRVTVRHACPVCGGQNWQRIHRRLSDRLFGLGLNFRRYRCMDCRWEGLRQRTY